MIGIDTMGLDTLKSAEQSGKKTWITISRRAKEKAASINQKKMKTIWSKPGKPHGKMTVRRFPPPAELVALVNLFKRATKDKDATPMERSLLYRMVEGFGGALKIRDQLRRLLPKMPKGSWKMVDNDTLTDPIHIFGVKFGSEEEFNKFLKFVEKQEDPEVLEKVLEYYGNFKAQINLGEPDDDEVEEVHPTKNNPKSKTVSQPW